MKWPPFISWINTGDPLSFARFASSKGPSGIVATHLTTAGDTTNQNAYTTASVAPGAGRLMLVWIVQSATTANGPSSFTGTFGGTLTLVNSFAVAALRISCYRYLATSSPASGTITINFAAGDTTSGCAWSIVEYANVDVSGSNGAGAIVQSAAAAGASGTTVNVTLAAFASPRNMHAYGLTHVAAESITSPGAGFTKRGDTNYATPGTGLATADAINANVADPSWPTASIPRYVAVEIKAA